MLLASLAVPAAAQYGNSAIVDPNAVLADSLKTLARDGTTVVGIDVDRPPLSEWPPLSVVMSRLAGLTELTQRAAAPSRTGRLAHSGITDLASQLAQAQRTFPQVERSSLWTVLGLLVGYLVLIGPIDYVLAHRVLRRPHLTWVTFPLLVAAAAVLAGWTARRTNGGSARRVTAWRVRLAAKLNGSLSPAGVPVLRSYWTSNTPCKEFACTAICRYESTTCARAFIRSSRFTRVAYPASACARISSRFATPSRLTPPRHTGGSSGQRRLNRPT